MENVKNYNYNVKSADSMLEPIELFFINKFNHDGAPKIDFLEMYGNNVYVLYFKNKSNFEFYKCYCHKYKTKDGDSFSFKVNYLQKGKINKNTELKLSDNSSNESPNESPQEKIPNRCIFLLPPSGVVMAEPTKNYIDNAAPEGNESLKNELENLAVAEKCSPDKICAKLILDNKDVKFAYSTLPEEELTWLNTESRYYGIDGVLHSAAINIKNTVGEEPVNSVLKELIKNNVLEVKKPDPKEPALPIIAGCEKTWQDLLTAAGINGDTFYLRFFPDGFARVYILLGDKENELKPVAHMYSWQTIDKERKIEVKIISNSSGATPTQGPVDNTNNEKPAGAGTKKGKNTKSTNDNTQTKDLNVDLTTAFEPDKVNIICAMLSFYSACAWFMIVVREFIEGLYSYDFDALKSDYKKLIGYTDEYVRLTRAKKLNEDFGPKRYKAQREQWYRTEHQVNQKESSMSDVVYDYGNCHVLLDALSEKLKELNKNAEYDDIINHIGTLKDDIETIKDIRNVISHYNLEAFKKETEKINVDVIINSIKDFIIAISNYNRFKYLVTYKQEVEKLLTQPVSIKFCPKCGEELPGGEYTFRPSQKGKLQL